MIAEFTFERGVEVLRSADTDEAVRVGDARKDTDVIATFELGTNSHVEFDERRI